MMEKEGPITLGMSANLSLEITGRCPFITFLGILKGLISRNGKADVTNSHKIIPKLLTLW